MTLTQFLNKDHLDQVCEIIESQSATNSDLKRFGVKWKRNQISEYLDKGESLGLFNDDILVAVILGRGIDNQVYEIDLTMTHSQFLRKGGMKNLFEALFEKLKKKGYKKIWLEVHEENLPATTLYRSFGFFEESQRAKYYPDQKAAILMTYDLNTA